MQPVGGANSFVSELLDEAVAGLNVASTNSAHRLNATGIRVGSSQFLSSASEHGVIFISATWNVGVGSDVRIRLGDDVTDSQQVFLTRLREAQEDDNARTESGILVSSVDVHVVSSGNRGAKTGECELRIGRNASNQIGYWLVYRSTATPADTQGTVQCVVEATLLRTDAPAPSSAPAGLNQAAVDARIAALRPRALPAPGSNGQVLTVVNNAWAAAAAASSSSGVTVTIQALPALSSQSSLWVATGLTLLAGKLLIINNVWDTRVFLTDALLAKPAGVAGSRRNISGTLNLILDLNDVRQVRYIGRSSSNELLLCSNAGDSVSVDTNWFAAML